MFVVVVMVVVVVVMSNDHVVLTLVFFAVDFSVILVLVVAVQLVDVHVLFLGAGIFDLLHWSCSHLINKQNGRVN